MYLLKLLALSLLCYTSLAKEEDVLELVDSDFKSRLAEHETALVMFYAPWCGHCKKLKPEFAKAAEDLIRNDPPVALIKVDCTEGGKETCSQHSVTGYPTLKIFRNGELSQDYNGPREASGIVKYMKAQVGPSSKELKNSEDLKQLLSAEKESTVIGFFEKESDLKAAFLKIADKLREKVKFAHTSSKELLDAQGVSDGIVLFRPQYLKNKFEENTVKYQGNAKSDEINQFITENFHGLVGLRKSDNRAEFENPLVVAYYNVDYVKNPKGTNYWRNRILKVAKELQGKVKFAISPKDEFQHELNEYGLDYVKDDKPVITARNAKNEKFILKEEFSVEALEVFVNDMLEGNLEAYIKSEPIPESNNEPVVVAVAKNFDDVVINNGKDTLIEFYAPWCGHCKKLEPIWSSVAQALSRTNIMIGRIDCHKFPSAAAEFGIRGYPTIKFLTADTDHTFNGDRVKENIVKFAVRMAGPPVQLIQHSKDLNSIKSMNNPFFMYVGEQEGPLWNIYHDSALKLQPYIYFYFMKAESAIQTTLDIPQIPSIFVHKDDQIYFYPDNMKNEKEFTNLNSSIFKWMKEERFETFPKVSRGNLNELIQTNKYLVLVIVKETKLGQIPVEMLEFRSMVENFVTKNRSKYYKKFQFGWVGSPELANSIALQVLPLPHLLVLNPKNHHHYLPENDCSEMTTEMLDTFLEMINNQSLPSLGGDGFLIGIYRMYFDTTTSLAEMWIGNPILTTMLFGLPLGFLSFIIYSICCAGILENYEDDGKDDESDSHEKMD